MASLNKSKPLEAGDFISLPVHTENEENMRKFVLPQKHPLIQNYKAKDEACVLVQNLPFGMNEISVRKYFSQFGTVLRCRVPLYPENGRMKGVAFVHFQESDVARVACSTMNNYIILGSLLKCKLIPGKFMKDEYFKSNDSWHHSKVNNMIKKMNLKSRNSIKEKKLIKKRQRLALATLAQTNSDISPSQLGIEVPKASSVKQVKKAAKKIPFKSASRKITPNGKKSSVTKKKTSKSFDKKTPAKSPVSRGVSVKSPRNRKTPAKSPLNGKTPAKSPLNGKTPAKSPLNGKTPAKSPLNGKTPAKSPANRKTPSKSPASRRITRSQKGSNRALFTQSPANAKETKSKRLSIKTKQ